MSAGSASDADETRRLRLLVLHGPNLNLLGQREPDTYGHATLDALNLMLARKATELGVALDVHQSNIEGELVDWLQQAQEQADGVVLNAAAYTHTSVAVRDALLAIDRPFIEVHLSNVFARDPFRHRSYLSDIAAGVITGLGADSYLLALDGLVRRLRGEA
ncbi:MAG TPA: type II 3-dehydroquinate dehydratase [Proteobacteria bacterium]|nr:type II 3-dehydroquinate dehydratase [Pseudomonadota bacterium]